MNNYSPQMVKKQISKWLSLVTVAILGPAPRELTPAVFAKFPLNHAKELLQKSNLSIVEIASICGYQESSAFSKLFRARYQTSPSEYRDTLQAKLFWSEKINQGANR